VKYEDKLLRWHGTKFRTRHLKKYLYIIDYYMIALEMRNPTITSRYTTRIVIVKIPT
jgi:hypothetical protein